MNDNRQPHNEAELKTPARLAQALGSLNARRIHVPERVDNAVLQAARAHLKPAAANARPRVAWGQTWQEFIAGLLVYWRRLVPYPALAAVVIVAAFLVIRFVPTRGSLRAQDFNRDGAVDVLDAFALAREVERGRPVDRQFDFNRDGVVNRRDADALAAQAVILKQGGRL